MDIKNLLENYIDENFQKILEDIRKVVNIKTVKGEQLPNAPFGLNIKKALEETLKIGENLGFKSVNLDNYIGYIEDGIGEEYIGVLGHLDVVPEGDHRQWKVSPFSGEVINNELIGRGVLDNKGPIISAMYSLKALKECLPEFNSKVRIIFGTNEESGDEDIKYYLTKEKSPKYAFTPDGQFPVVFSEKGIYTFLYKQNIVYENTDLVGIEGGNKSNVVPGECISKVKNISIEKIKEIIEYMGDIPCKFTLYKENSYIKILCEGTPTHGSSPNRGVNPIIWTCKLLNNLLDKEDSLKNFMNFIENKVGLENNGEYLNIKKENEETGDLTISCGIIKMDKNKIEAKFNIRHPINISKENISENLKIVGNENNIEFIMGNYNPPLYFPKDSYLVKTLQKVFKDVTKREDTPVALGGGTYAKLMPNTVAFGPNYKEYKGNPHGYNEKIDLKMLKEGMVMYALGIYYLSKKGEN